MIVGAAMTCVATLGVGVAGLYCRNAACGALSLILGHQQAPLSPRNWLPLLGAIHHHYHSIPRRVRRMSSMTISRFTGLAEQGDVIISARKMRYHGILDAVQPVEARKYSRRLTPYLYRRRIYSCRRVAFRRLIKE